jgi:predicted transcriptional regulator
MARGDFPSDQERCVMRVLWDLQEADLATIQEEYNKELEPPPPAPRTQELRR